MRRCGKTKFIKNKFFLILTSAALIIAMGCSVLSIMGLGVIVTDAAEVLCTPFRVAFNAVGSGFKTIGTYFKGMDSLIDENRKLTEEKAELERELDIMKYAADENAALREYIGANPEDFKLSYIDAAVISKGAESYVDIFTLNRGKTDGVETGMAVITPDGALGYVCEVSLFSCRVTTLIETDSKTGIYVRRSGQPGILYGDYELKTRGCANGKYFDPDADIEVGDLIMTSGTGSIYPRDLIVGEVTDISIDSYTRTKSVTIKCRVDFENIGNVMIISGWESVAADTETEDTAPETDGSGA